MEKWQVLDSEKIINNKWITIEKQICKVNSKITINDYYVVRKNDYVILIIEKNNEIFFVKQYRQGIQQFILNLPMGLIDKNEKPEEAAKREILEETGQKSDKVLFLGDFFIAPSYITTKAFVFYTNQTTSVEDYEKPNDDEELEIVKINKKELLELMKNNQLKDMSSIIALYLAKQKLNIF